MPDMPRTATVERTTRETEITLTVNLDGSGAADIDTGLPFLDHMLTALACHGRLDLSIRCKGDLDVDDHHTAEDVALALGDAIDRALGDRAGVQRFGTGYAPLDESLCRTVIDLSGRSGAWIEIPFTRPMIGTLATENIGHFFRSLAQTLRATVHVDVIRGENDHHKAEAAFKSCALALRQSVARDDRRGGVPSTKGTLG